MIFHLLFSILLIMHWPKNADNFDFKIPFNMEWIFKWFKLFNSQIVEDALKPDENNQNHDTALLLYYF